MIKDRQFNAIVRKQMILLDMNVEDLSKLLGIGLSTMYYKLKNPGQFTLCQLRLLSRALKLSDEDRKSLIL